MPVGLTPSTLASQGQHSMLIYQSAIQQMAPQAPLAFDMEAQMAMLARQSNPVISNPNNT